jgi:DNA-binding transcriptional LysR family regulator
MHTNIELRHLRYFVAVADTLHFGKAAERLGMSQPPLSQQIRQLEDTVGARLLTRTNRRVALTEPGKVFLDEAREILAKVEAAIELAQRAERGELGELRIGFTRTVPLTQDIPRAILTFRQQFPAVHLQLEEMMSRQQIDALLERKLHIGILRLGTLPQSLVSKRMFRDPLVAVVPNGHPALKRVDARGKLSTKALAQEPFVVFARTAGAGVYEHVFSLCRDAGFTPRIVQEAREASTIIGLVATGLGVSILPASCSHIHIEGVSYVPLADASAVSEVHVAYREDERSPLVPRFIKLILTETR